ncbi:MAG: S1C family serine protease [Candidatus Buchananbacteria bacterium]
MKKFNFNLIIYLLIAIICGFISALIALFLLTSGSIPFLSNYNVSQRDIDRQIVIDQPRNVIVQQDVQIKQLENNLLPALANIYQKKKTNQGYTDSQIISQGVVLTSDGWILLPEIKNSGASLSYEAVGYQNKQYDVKNFISDTTTGLSFARITGKNLPVASIGRSKDVSIGQTVIVVNQRKKMEIANITEVGYVFNTEKDIVQNSDLFNKKLFVNINLDKSYNGAVVTNLKGEIVGIVNDGQVIPSDYFSRTINDVLSGGKISRPELGIDFIDLSSTEGTKSLGEQGAYVTNVDKSSQAYGKIKAGDIIKKVNDLELGSFLSLSEAVNNFNTGNKVELLYSRAGKDASINVVLN